MAEDQLAVAAGMDTRVEAFGAAAAQALAQVQHAITTGMDTRAVCRVSAAGLALKRTASIYCNAHKFVFK